MEVYDPPEGLGCRYTHVHLVDLSDQTDQMGLFPATIETPIQNLVSLMLDLPGSNAPEGNP